MSLGLLLISSGCSKSFTLSKEFQDSVGGSPTLPGPTPGPGPGPTPVSPPDLTNPRNSASVFVTGHSLTDFLPNFLPNLTSSVGDTFLYNYQFIPGSPIASRTRGNESNPNWDGYTSGSNFNGSNMNVVNELRSPTTITGRYDSLVIAERHDLIGPLQYHDTVRYLRNYHDRFIAGNAQGQTYFYEAWWNLNRDNPAP